MDEHRERSYNATGVGMFEHITQRAFANLAEEIQAANTEKAFGDPEM